MKVARRGEATFPRKHVLVGLVVGVPVSGVFLYLASRNVDFTNVAHALRRADPARVTLSVALIGVMYWFQAMRWRRIARAEADLPTTRFLSYIVGGLACNNVLPGRIGDLLRAQWLASNARIPRARALATVVADRACDLLALVVLLAVTFPLAPHPAWLGRIDVVAAAGGAALVVLLLAARHHAKRRDADARRSRVGRAFSDGLTTISHTVNRRSAPVVAALSFLAWGAWATSAWLTASSLGITLSVPELLFVTAVLNLGVAIPSSPGFVGTYQWLCVAALALFSVGHADAFAFSVLFQAVWYVPTTLVGIGLIAARGSSLGLRTLRGAHRTVDATL